MKFYVEIEAKSTIEEVRRHLKKYQQVKTSWKPLFFLLFQTISDLKPWLCISCWKPVVAAAGAQRLANSNAGSEVRDVKMARKTAAAMQ